MAKTLGAARRRRPRVRDPLLAWATPPKPRATSANAGSPRPTHLGLDADLWDATPGEELPFAEWTSADEPVRGTRTNCSTGHARARPPNQAALSRPHRAGWLVALLAGLMGLVVCVAVLRRL